MITGNKAALKRNFKRVAGSVIACTVLLSSFGPLSITKAAETVTFKTQVGGTYDGMPLFDGNSNHLDAYLDTYLGYVGLEGAAVYATDSRGDYTLTTGPNKGRIIPGAAQAEDNVQGVSTDFPCGLALGQSWDTNVMNSVGTTLGNERINTEDYADTANFNAVGYSVVSDVRSNPLNGRIEESCSEDPYLTSAMTNAMAAGVTGTSLKQSNNGFWLKCILGTKHYTDYSAEWFR